MIYTTSKGNGGEYPYFGCLGRHSKRTDCDLPYLGVAVVEEQVRVAWQGERASWETTAIAAIETDLAADLRAYQTESAQEHGMFTRRNEQVQRERLQWAEKAISGTVPDDIARDKQLQLGTQLASIQGRQSRLVQTIANHAVS